MKRLLIANRGEIALRVARSARELGLGTVAVHAPEDAGLSERYGCDERIALPGRGAAAYLDVEAVVDAARTGECDALHPGYGFLSENPALARACEAAGIVFVGPRVETLELFGDKARACAFAARHDVPVLESTGSPATAQELERFAREPSNVAGILLKAASGGGGRGMRTVCDPGALAGELERARSEAARAFGSDAVFAERWVEHARHVEVQVIADAHGAVGHLWERDCTLQRRHQKLVEIAPAPALDAALRDALLDAALRLARESRYVGVGTFEFLLDLDAGGWFFIEANPRLQVEHTVTEETTGVDLVEAQIEIARGASLASLGLTEAPPPRGHAVQVRVLAETMDAQGETRPGGGTIERLALPGGPGVRVDTAMASGLAPHPAFDSLIAKLVVSTPGDSFARALARTRRALGELRIDGTATNIALLEALLARPELPGYAVTTGFLAEHAAELAAACPATPRAAAADEAPAGQEAVRAPLVGTVLELAVARGDHVASGEPLCVLEAMKMEHVVTSPCAGRVERLFVGAGDVVAEGQDIVWIAASGEDARFEQDGAARDPDAIRPDLAEVRERHALLYDEARPEAVERRRRRGQRTARENIAQLADPGSFVEYGGLAVAAQRSTRDGDELARRTPADAIVTGTASIGAEHFGADAARCAVLACDATVLAGTQGWFHHHKIDRMLELAERHAMPIVFLPEGGGGRPSDTDVGNVSAAGLKTMSFHQFAKLSGKVPRVSIVAGYCFAGSAAIAGCADVIIATRGSNLGMGGPAMIEGGGLGSFEPGEVGPSEVQAANGVIDVLVDDEVEGVEVAKRYLSYFQGRRADWSAADQRTLRHAIPENRRRVYDVRRVIETLCDGGSVLELRATWAPGMITALVRIEGRPVGLLANDPMHLGGAIDDAGSEKAARFLQLCDSFGLPIVSLCDTPGFMVGPEIETRAHVRKTARFFIAGAAIRVPLFCVILRKGYGLGAQAMAGGSFTTPFFTLAWPTGEIGGMGLEGAVRVGFGRQLDAIEDPDERRAAEEKLVAAMYRKGKAISAASLLEFDGVIDPAETRATIVRGLDAAGPPAASHRPVDAW